MRKQTRRLLLAVFTIVCAIGRAQLARWTAREGDCCHGVL